MLSREVATSMRGRTMEVAVFPFNFREALAHRGLLTEKNWILLPKAAVPSTREPFATTSTRGGLPGGPRNCRPRPPPSLQGYVDVAVLRHVIERHGVSNVVALRWLQRHLLGNPPAPFSIQ